MLGAARGVAPWDRNRGPALCREGSHLMRRGRGQTFQGSGVPTWTKKIGLTQQGLGTSHGQHRLTVRNRDTDVDSKSRGLPLGFQKLKWATGTGAGSEETWDLMWAAQAEADPTVNRTGGDSLRKPESTPCTTKAETDPKSADGGRRCGQHGH